MSDLGYERYGIHGSDMGADVAGQLDQISAGKAIGVHMATDTDTIVAVASFMSADLGANPNLTDEQKQRVGAKFAALPGRMGYIGIQSTRPKTIGYALNDSPVGQLAWIIEKFEAWTNPEKVLPEDAVDLDQLLTNVSLYWFGKGGAASANAIWESMKAMGWAPPTATPQGVAAFNADDLARPLLDPEHKTAHWSEFKAGGHFPAMEEPALLAGDIQKFFAGLIS
jgi:pimeloyl-ACP methyl ester carboxylesterase